MFFCHITIERLNGSSIALHIGTQGFSDNLLVYSRKKVCLLYSHVKPVYNKFLDELNSEQCEFLYLFMQISYSSCPLFLHTHTHIHKHTQMRSLSIHCIRSLLSNNCNRNWIWKNRTSWNTAHGHVILKWSLHSEKFKTSNNWPSLHPNPRSALMDISDTVNACVEQMNSRLSLTLPLL